MDNGIFTVVGPECDLNGDKPILFEQFDDHIKLTGLPTKLTVDRQQAGELGMLLFSMIDDAFDNDSVYELLNSYGCEDKEIRNLAYRLRELANVLEGDEGE